MRLRTLNKYEESHCKFWYILHKFKGIRSHGFSMCLSCNCCSMLPVSAVQLFKIIFLGLNKYLTLCLFADTVSSIILLFFFYFLELIVSGGKLGVAACNANEKKAWARFLKQNPKTKKMTFFNDVTREIYKSAYRYKQSQFNSYLNGQRLFRWDVTKKIENIKTVVCSYEKGIIPKENISFHRYLLLPVDPNVKDLSLASRALNHTTATKHKN